MQGFLLRIVLGISWVEISYKLDGSKIPLFSYLCWTGLAFSWFLCFLFHKLIQFWLCRVLSQQGYKEVISRLLFFFFSSASVSSLPEVVLEPQEDRSTSFLSSVWFELRFSEMGRFISRLIVTFDEVFNLASPLSSDSYEETTGDLEAECWACKVSESSGSGLRSWRGRFCSVISPYFVLGGTLLMCINGTAVAEAGG